MNAHSRWPRTVRGDFFGIRLLGISFLLIVVQLVVHEAYAQTWDGGGANNNWSTGQNWNANIAPANNGTANIVMAGTTRLLPNVNTPWSINGLTFTAGGGGFNITGSALTLGPGGIVSTSSNRPVVEAPIILGSTQHWIAPTTDSSLRVFNVTLSPYDLTVTGAVDFIRSANGTGSLTFLGNSVRNISASTRTGETNILGGVVIIEEGSLGTGPVMLDGGQIRPVNTTNEPVTIANHVVLGPGGGTAFTSRAWTISGPIDGPGALTIGGSNGLLKLTGVNSYSGGTVVDSPAALEGTTDSLQGNIAVNGGQGSLQLAIRQDFDGEFRANVSGSSGIGKRGAGVVTFTGSYTYAGLMQIEQGGIRLGRSNILPDNGVISFSNESGVFLDLNNHNETVGYIANGGSRGGEIRLGSATLTSVVNHPTATVIEYRGTMSGTGGFTKRGPVALMLAGTNIYSGRTTVEEGRLILRGPTALSEASPLLLANAAGVVLDLDNSSRALASLAGGGPLGGDVALGTGSLVVGGDGASTTYGGSISGTGSVTKTGTGTLTLSGISTFSGGTVIADGVLEVNSDAALGGPSGALVLDGGAFRVLGTTFQSTSRNIHWNPDSNVIEVEDAANRFTLNQGVTGAGQLVKAGAGVLALAASNSYTGATIVNGGTLRIENTLPSAGGAVTLNAAGRLEAAGVLQRQVSGTGALAAIGTLIAGDVANPHSIDFEGLLEVGAQFIGLADADYALLDGDVRLAGGTLASFNGIELGGTLAGFGVVNGEFVNHGTVNGTNVSSPVEFRGVVRGDGAFQGHVQFAGLYAPSGQTPIELEYPEFGGALSLLIGGLEPGIGYNQLLIEGDAELGGTLSISLSNGFQPRLGDEFTLLQGGRLVGAFSSIGLPTLDEPYRFTISQTDNRLAVQVVSEPCSSFLAILGLVSSLCRFRSKAKHTR